MKKNLKVIPVVALTTLFLTGCVSDPVKPSSGNLLLDALNDMEVGEVKKKQVDKMFNTKILTSSDKNVKKALYREDVFTPFWLIGEGEEESVYEEEVKKASRTRTYQVFDNEVIRCTDDSSIYPYDPSTIDLDNDEDDGISTKETVVKGEAFIYHDLDEDTLQYTYTRNENINNAFSFTGGIDFDSYLFDDCLHDGGLGAEIAKAKEDVEDQFNSFADQVSDWERYEDYKAVKHEDGSFSVSFTGDLCMPLYSAEWVWGCEFAPDDDDRTTPIRKTTHDYDNIYVDRRIRTHYEFEIDKNAIITYGTCTYMCYHTSVLEDPNGLYSVEQRNLCYPLTKDMVNELRPNLFIPEKFAGRDNPYLAEDYIYDDYLPYNVDYFGGSGDAQGDFELDNLPDPSEYRLIENMSDVGAWINAYNLILEDH